MVAVIYSWYCFVDHVMYYICVFPVVWQRVRSTCQFAPWPAEVFAVCPWGQKWQWENWKKRFTRKEDLLPSFNCSLIIVSFEVSKERVSSQVIFSFESLVFRSGLGWNGRKEVLFKVVPPLSNESSLCQLITKADVCRQKFGRWWNLQQLGLARRCLFLVLWVGAALLWCCTPNRK